MTLSFDTFIILCIVYPGIQFIMLNCANLRTCSEDVRHIEALTPEAATY